MDLDHKPISPRYWLCGAGFWIAGLALALLCLSDALLLWVVLTWDQGLAQAMQQPWFTWGVGLPITAGALVGSYLLWGRWSDRSWQRRAGPLVLMNLFDSISWGLSHAAAPGLQAPLLEHEWLVECLVRVFGWLEFFLFAHLAAEVASHLGVKAAADAGRTAWQFAVAGLGLTVLFILTQTRWDAGWPLLPVPRPNPSGELMRLGSTFLRVVTALQVATLCLIAGSSCRRTARELAREEEEQLTGTTSFEPSGSRDPDLGAGWWDDELPR
ncbi:hypothetical protein [Tautonia sociabilis]|uniref:Uncharacterized protein n=1 Tax=Tautonia sociabilis TaxID=2080755 RepID=A0A432MLW9_9BACT|nr:hypothetical protein [Tautonia sociabilis]RUL88423.1 hypothetical protein TsocGM_06825 [Tautonia sociabilis]